MPDTRKKNWNWMLPEGDVRWEHVRVALLMDIRDELQALNKLFGCYNLTSLPQQLRDIKAMLQAHLRLKRQGRGYTRTKKAQVPDGS